MTPLQTLKTEFFAHTKRVRYDSKVFAQTIAPDGAVLIGPRLTPWARDTATVCHELCHFAEIDDARMARPAWGLDVPKVVVCGTVCLEPTTMSLTARELRVMAYQANLHEYLGLPVSVPNLVSSLQYLPDFLYVPLEDGRSAYGDDAPTSEEMGYNERNDSRIRWMANRVQELRAEYTLERFRSEWFRKIKLLAS